jgi:hypothetical protein
MLKEFTMTIATNSDAVGLSFRIIGISVLRIVYVLSISIFISNICITAYNWVDKGIGLNPFQGQNALSLWLFALSPLMIGVFYKILPDKRAPRPLFKKGLDSPMVAVTVIVASILIVAFFIIWLLNWSTVWQQIEQIFSILLLSSSPGVLRFFSALSILLLLLPVIETIIITFGLVLARGEQATE